MSILDLFRRAPAAAPPPAEPVVQPRADSAGYLSLDDPRIVEFLRFGDMTATGITVNVERALKNTAMFRAVCLISYSIGMLPLQLISEDTKEKASSHPLYRVLHRRPNAWQSAFDFRTLMQMRGLVKGNGYALVVRSPDIRRGGKLRISQLIPLDPDRVEVKQLDDWSVVYVYTPKKGGARTYKAQDILHLRGLSLDGLVGVSVVKQAAEAIGLALAAELAAARIFRNGSLVGGALEHPGKLSPDAYARLAASLEEKSGADNAGKNLILEEGMKYSQYASNAKDAQLADIRKMQVEEIGRATGVPRPLLMVDETSWGSGIEALGRFFVQFALGPWFEAWQQACERILLTDEEQDAFSIKFNPGALLRGSMKDQADFFTKALGAGGAPAWMTQNEVRDVMDMPGVGPDGDKLNPGVMGAPQTPESGGDPDPKDPPTKKDETDDGDEA